MMNTLNMPRFATGLALLTLALAGCAQVKEKPVLPAIQDELRKAVEGSPEPSRGTPASKTSAKALPAAVEAALAPQSRLELPKGVSQPAEARFDLAVNAASAQQVFLGIASGTRYSMLLHPEVAGSITVNLKDVTVPEAMDALRELYGYEYRIDGNRIMVQPLTAQTRFYSIAYPASLRQGNSELRVISGSIADSGAKSGGSAGSSASSGGGSSQVNSSRVVTSVASDFWGELKAAIGMLIGCSASCPEGRSISVSPHTGMLMVRALPVEQRQVNEYLKAARVQVERQVMIEAKIIEVTLNENAQSGINWAHFRNGVHDWSKGATTSSFPVPGNTPLPATGATTATLSSLLGTGLPATAATSAGVFGLAFQTSSFAALLNFLEDQGQVQVLSSPRIAAINNQKAVLKVGTDEFFVTEITSTPSTSTNSSTTSTSITTQPFFSGIALDVTPQIDDADNIILHVHPSVSQVVTDSKKITVSGLAVDLPLAKSSVSETDSVVRLKDGEIAAIGGLMKRESRDASSGVPGIGEVPGLGWFFKNTNATRQKQELVILLKPTLIKQQSDWMEGVRDASVRLQSFTPPPVR